MRAPDAVPATDQPDPALLAARLSSICQAMGAWRLAVARRLAVATAPAQPFTVLAAVERNRPLEPVETALPLSGFERLIRRGTPVQARPDGDDPLARWLAARGGSELRGWPLPNDRLPCVFFLAAFAGGRVPDEGRLRVAEQGMEALARGLTPPQWLMAVRLGTGPGAQVADEAGPRPAARTATQAPGALARRTRTAGGRRDRRGGTEATCGWAGERTEPPLALVGPSPAARALGDAARRAAGVDAHVLLIGENGTGREELARWIHAQSTRASGPFHVLPCIALPGARLQLALLGNGAGSNPAARPRAGLLELACTGTLYLEEIGELSRELQSRLLQALRAREVARPGEQLVRRIDVRVIASSRHDLWELAQRGRFLEELYWTLAGCHLTVPPLSARLDDLPALLHALARRAGGDDSVLGSVDADALTVMRRCAWTGNLIQLSAEVERMLSQHGRQPVVRSDMLSDTVRRESQASEVHELQQLLPLARAHDVVEVLMIRRALRSTEGNKTAAARALGLSRQGLYKKLRRHRLEARQGSEPSV